MPVRDLSANRRRDKQSRESDERGCEMNDKPIDELPFEPERYELQAAPAFHFELDRREFFKALGGGVFVFILLDSVLAQESGAGRRRGADRTPQELGAWLHIAEDGRVAVFTGKVE